MPTTKKPAGTAVDHRNGRRIQLTSAAPLERFALPKRTPAWSTSTRKAWSLFWEDPISSLLSVADRPVLLRWADALERATSLLLEADADPVATGSQGQPVANPMYGVADSALRVAKDCEAQLGIGALHRARLGIETAQGQRSLLELNMMLEGAGDEVDPRLP